MKEKLVNSGVGNSFTAPSSKRGNKEIFEAANKDKIERGGIRGFGIGVMETLSFCCLVYNFVNRWVLWP